MVTIAERFHAAVKICTGSQAIKPRLANAWVDQLDTVLAAELPRNLRAPFKKLRAAMYSVEPQPSECAPRASIRKMSARQAADHTATIFLIASELRSKPATNTKTVPMQAKDTTRESLPPQRLN